MALGKWLTRGAAPAQHSRMIVSDGFRMGPSASVVGNAAWGWSGFVRALGIPGFGRGVAIITDLIGGLPWDAYTDYGRDYAEKINPRPVLLEQPNPEEARINTFAAWTGDLLLHGNAVGVIAERNAYGVPTAVVPVPACLVGVRRSDGWTYSALPAGEIEYQIGGQTFSRHDVIHVKGLAEPNALKGVGVLEAHLNGAGSLDLAAELARQARSIGQDGVPTGVLKATSPEVKREDLKASKDAWMEAQQTRTIAALGPNTDFQALSWNPEQLQLIEARKLSLLEVANILGLPPRFLGASSGDSMTYSTSETEGIELLKFGSPGGYVARFEQTLSLAYPRGTWVKANLDALLRADTKTRYEAHKLGIDSRFLRPSEARKLEDLPPVEGIDDEPEPPQQEQADQQVPAAVVPFPGSDQNPQEEAS
jgi:HK97 family phage portal protein